MLNRRQLVKALGLGALSATTLGRRTAFGDPPSFPSRVVFFIQPHAHIPKAWNIAIPGAPTDSFAERALVDLTRDELSPALRPLHPFRDRLLAIEGISHLAVLADLAATLGEHTDSNHHDLAVAGLLTGTRALQTPNLPCLGGSRSLDQELALRTAAPGRFGSRVYGSDYIPNASVAPFSFLGPGQAAPKVSDPTTAFADLLGLQPPDSGGSPTRADLLAAQRGSVLDVVRREYDALAPMLDGEGRRKLEAHRDLVRDLELSLGAAHAGCDSTFDATGDTVTQFMRLIRQALACDLTRVITYVAPVPAPPEFGYPASAVVHADYAHASMPGGSTCGTPFNPVAEQAMTDLGIWYASHVATLLQELDSVPEGSGTLLDHTVVVWISELGTPTHLHHDAPILLAGGCNGFFRTGRYVRYPRTLVNPMRNYPLCGPPQNRLYVSLLQAMGQPDTTFGRTEVLGSDDSTISLAGPLTELQV